MSNAASEPAPPTLPGWDRLELTVRRLMDEHDALRKRGLEHHTERLGEEDWRVWFVRARPASPSEAQRGELPPRSPVCDRDGCVTIDVRGLEPPEPMIRTLQALDALPEGVTLVQINQRVPRFLLPKLDDRGFEYEAHAADDGTVRLHIRHRRKGND